MALTLVFGAENHEIVSVVRNVVCLCQRKSVRMVMLLHGGFVGISTILSVRRCTTKGPRQKIWKFVNSTFSENRNGEYWFFLRNIDNYWEISKVSAQFCNTYFCFSVVCEKNLTPVESAKSTPFPPQSPHKHKRGETETFETCPLLLEIASALALTLGVTSRVVT